MAVTIGILHLFPDLAAIGQLELQVYCDEWLQRPLPRECGMAQIVIDRQRNMQVILDEVGAVFHGDDVFIPIDELLGFIVDRHFTDANERRRLHTQIRDARRRWAELGKDYEATVGRVGTLYFVCKNPCCQSKMITDKQAAEGQRINFGPVDITYTTCYQTFAYDGHDFKLKFD